MGSPYLNSNESIVLSTHNIVINSLQAEAILTNTRLLLIDSGDSAIRPQDIPFASIETVTIGESMNLDPMLSLSILVGPDRTHPLGIVFPQAQKTNRSGERDEWAIRIKELSMAARNEGGARQMELTPPWILGPLPGATEAGSAGSTETAEDPFRNPSLIPKKPRAAAGSSKKRAAIVAGVVVVALVVIVIAAFLLAPLTGTTGPAVTPVPTTVITAERTTVPTTIPTTIVQTPVTPAMTPAVTTAPTADSAMIVPATGVWAYVMYGGNYSGTIGAPGRFETIKNAGNHFYQIPARNETISAVVQKLDNSGNVLAIAFYDNGVMVKNGSVKTPGGTLSLFFDLRLH